MNFVYYIAIGLAVWAVLISVFAIMITRKDKRAAQNNKWRVKEATLLIVSALGGSLAMLLTMRIIRHKTDRKKFMLGIPLIMIVQLAILAGLIIIYWHFFRVVPLWN